MGQVFKGSATVVQDGEGWVINPGHEFTLTLTNITRDKAIQALDILAQEGMIYRNIAKQLTRFVYDNKVECKEVSCFVASTLPEVLNSVNDMKDKSRDWKSAVKIHDEDAMDEIQEEFYTKAVKKLDQHPHSDISALYYVSNDCEWYAEQLAQVIAHTFSMSPVTPPQNQVVISEIKGWKTDCTMDGNTCAFCKRYAKKRFTRDERPSTPHHIGCRCVVEPIIRI